MPYHAKITKIYNFATDMADVLYIHARLGSCNWSYIVHTDYKNEPWYMESCDDSWDSTYCDIYAKIEVKNEGSI